MKYAITIADQYKALVDIDLGEKNWSGDQPFTGTITSDEYGVTQIEGGKVQPDGSLAGTASLGGHAATFAAKITDQRIAGDIRVGWFLHRTFNGVQTT